MKSPMVELQKLQDSCVAPARAACTAPPLRDLTVLQGAAWTQGGATSIPMTARAYM
jgi:hypothetical protein